MSEAKQHLERALETALAQYAETMGEVFPILPLLDVIGDPDFWALAEMDNGIFRIRVSTGTVDRTTALWASAFSDANFWASFGQVVDADAVEMTHISLVWLMLHEMHHFQMGHFDPPSTITSSDASFLEERRLVERTQKIAAIHSTDAATSSLILEMQADHDATEMLLDAYSPDEWISLRARVAAISAVTMLIERADSFNQAPVFTHPKAATRIFQLLGHVMDMPSLSANPELNKNTDGKSHPNKLPTKEEQVRFAVQVVVPSFFDAVSFARIAAAQSITHELGSATEFFQDVQTAKLMSDSEARAFVTIGALQWAALLVKKT